jgi:hypothetical protein
MKVIKLENQTGQELEAFVTDCGIVFLPAALFGNEEAILLCCGYDNAEAVRDASGRIYATAEWLAAEFPEYASQIKQITKEARQ